MVDNPMQASHPRRRRQSLAGAMIFDLDDTLYPERDFAISGFAAAARLLADLEGIPDLEAICVELFDSGTRDQIFDRALSRMCVKSDPQLISALVAAYRFHQPEIRLYTDAKRFLAVAPEKTGLGVITDGLAKTQRAKIAALGLDKLMHHVICTDEWGRKFWKPHPRAYTEMEEYFGLDGPKMVYVGDNSAKDFLTPNERGWLTIQICRPKRVHTSDAPGPRYAARERIVSLDELTDIVTAHFDSLWPPGAVAAGRS